MIMLSKAAPLLAALLAVGCSAFQRDHADYVGAGDFRIYYIPPTIDTSLAARHLEAGVESWLNVYGEKYRKNCVRLKFYIHDDWRFPSKQSKTGYATGEIDLINGRVDLAWWTESHAPPYLPALHHELEHIRLGHYHGD